MCVVEPKPRAKRKEARHCYIMAANLMKSTGRIIWLFAGAVLITASCGILPEKVPVSDPRVQALLKAAALFDRAQYGFSPLPSSGYVRLETRPRAGYDAMLHFDVKTSRTIAFQKSPAGYKWIGEQETFQGPREYDTVDGTSKEQICLTYEIRHVSGVPLNRLSVTYGGPDTRLMNRFNLALADVKPILKEWGY